MARLHVTKVFLAFILRNFRTSKCMPHLYSLYFLFSHLIFAWESLLLLQIWQFSKSETDSRRFVENEWVRRKADVQIRLRVRKAIQPRGLSDRDRRKINSNTKHKPKLRRDNNWQRRRREASCRRAGFIPFHSVQARIHLFTALSLRHLSKPSLQTPVNLKHAPKN